MVETKSTAPSPADSPRDELWLTVAVPTDPFHGPTARSQRDVFAVQSANVERVVGLLVLLEIEQLSIMN